MTIAVWVGYDNAKKKQTLGSGRTGGNVAVPIFAPIMEAVWKEYAPRTVLAPPREAASQLIATQATSKKKSFEIVEYLRKDAKGKAMDKVYALVSARSPQTTAPSAQTTRPSRFRNYNTQDSFASARPYEQARAWNWFGDQPGWGNSSPFGQGPSTFGQGGGFWGR